MNLWLKRGVTFCGLMLFLPGLALSVGFLCVILVMVADGSEEAIQAGLIGFTVAAITLGAGGVTFWHGLASLWGKDSKPLRLPPAWMLAAGFGLLVAMAWFVFENNFAAGLFFPPLLLAAAALPPLAAISWFTGHQDAGLTWRRGSVAFAGGGTISVMIALTLQILLSAIILALVFNLANLAAESIEQFFEALAGRDIATAMTSQGFLLVFVQVALIAPLTEELAKPLVTLPLLGRIQRQQAFLVGAMAGAGFAALENVLYAGFGYYFWAGILLVRAIGGAIHPLGAGLVALGWQDVLHRESNAWLKWLTRYGMAVGIHALWNGGSLLVVTLAGARFFGELPPEIDVLGVSAAGTTLALLIILGLFALWLGRATVHGLSWPADVIFESEKVEFMVSDRSAAIWALACLAAIVPAGIAGLQLLM
jgi:RsiW-degrading membrane proteinase PrsW (M82 family)